MALNVLVVDDSDVIRSMIARTLKLANVPIGQLHEASNGKEALGVLEDAWIDLVLADINMPVMDGAEMVSRMRENPETADVPVIVVSTEGATERIADLTNRGVAAWVRKPFTPEEIRDVVTQVTSEWVLSRHEDAHADEVFVSVMEQFAFTFPEPVAASSLPGPGDELLVARTAFTGAVSGTLAIAAPAELCARLAAVVLGVDELDESASVQGADTLGEVANITAGHLATSIEANATTDLHPPTVERLSLEEWDSLATSSMTRCYLAEDHPILLAVTLRAGTAAA